jgi:thioredoxin 1
MNEDEMDTQIITDEEFHDRVIKNDKPVVVEFGADWCGACHILAPVIKRVLIEFDRRIEYCKMDVEENGLISKEYGIRDLPTLLFFKDGEVKDHIIGAMPKKVLRELINNLLI